MIARQLQKSFEFALTEAVRRRHEYVTLEHLLYALLHDHDVVDVVRAREGAVYLLRSQGVNKLDVLNYIAHGIARDDDAAPKPAFIGGDDEPREIGDPLKSFALNLNEKAKKGEIDPLIGRGPELERTIQILCRRRKNNPLFVGEPGVGKTAIAEGLALKIQRNEVPAVLQDAEVWSLDMGA